MPIPMPIFTPFVWQYNEEKYTQLKNASFRDKKERNKYFRELVKYLDKNILSKTEHIIDYGAINVSCKFEGTVNLKVQSCSLSTSIESPNVGIYDWLDEDFFVISLENETKIRITAEEMKSEIYSEKLSKLFN
jgi:hypothetical protein